LFLVRGWLDLRCVVCNREARCQEAWAGIVLLGVQRPQTKQNAVTRPWCGGALLGFQRFFVVFFPGVWLVELLVRCMAPCMAPCVAPAAFFVFGPWLVGPSVCCVQQRGTLSGSMGGYSVAGRAAAANKAKRGHEAMVWGGLAGLAFFFFFFSPVCGWLNCWCAVWLLVWLLAWLLVWSVAGANKAKRGHEAMVWGALLGTSFFVFFFFLLFLCWSRGWCKQKVGAVRSPPPHGMAIPVLESTFLYSESGLFQHAPKHSVKSTNSTVRAPPSPPPVCLSSCFVFVAPQYQEHRGKVRRIQNTSKQ
jgi:hypothetical protein